MSRTPGIVIPSSFSSIKELKADIQRRDEVAGFTAFNQSEFNHSSDEVDAFLAHFGVKGMHWGQRKTKQTKGQREAASAKRKKLLKVAGIAGGVAATAFVSAYLARQGMVPAKDLRLKEEQLARVRRAVDKAVWQNPVHKNAAADIRDFVRKLG